MVSPGVFEDGATAPRRRLTYDLANRRPATSITDLGADAVARTGRFDCVALALASSVS
jgi:hypothetical protein